MPEAGRGYSRLRAGAVLQSALDGSLDAARSAGDRHRQAVRHHPAECALARADRRGADLADEIGASLRGFRERRHAAANPLLACCDRAARQHRWTAGEERRAEGHVFGDRVFRASGPAWAGEARHGAERKLGARARLRQDRHLLPQRGCPVRRPHPGLRRQHLAWARPSGADARRSWRRHAGKIILEADGLLLRQARADALRGKRGDGGRRFALGQAEDFRGKAAWDHRHDRAWLAGGVVLLATGLVPPERAAAESAARRAAA